MDPPLCSVRPRRRRARVVLPEPLAPTTAMIEGVSAWIASDSPARASVLSRPSPPAKRLLTSTASISGTMRLGQMACHLGAVDVAQLGFFGAAAFRRQCAARMEGAAAWQVAQQWRQAGDAGERAARLERGQRGDQRSCIGMAGAGDDLCD